MVPALLKPPSIPLLALVALIALLVSLSPAGGNESAERHDSRFITEPQLETLVADSLFPEWTHATVARIARCESSLRGLSITLLDTQARRVSDVEDSKGLMQVNTRVYSRLDEALDLFNPVENLMGAYIVWLDNGKRFDPWSCF